MSAAGAHNSLVVGAAGQDGHYLTELLRARGDRVVAIGRGDLPLADRERVAQLMAESAPREIYYLAGVFGSSESAAEDPRLDYRRSHEVHVEGWLNFLDAAYRNQAGMRLFYAASSRVFGEPATSPQNESTPLAPQCIYGITKSAGVQLCRFYRARGVHCSNGILYNHESPRRPPAFVSRKIVQAAVDIKLGSKRTLKLGDLRATVDWGAAHDYVDAMARIVALDRPDDYIIASGEAHTVEDFVEAAFSAAGLAWQGYVTDDRSILRGAPSRRGLVGDSSRLRERTGWRPTLGFRDMVRLMVEAELRSRQQEAA